VSSEEKKKMVEKVKESWFEYSRISTESCGIDEQNRREDERDEFKKG
jgi:hypothetical protein